MKHAVLHHRYEFRYPCTGESTVPSHVTHILFGNEVLAELGIPLRHAPWFYVGCQGPDLFLHNQRTMPRALSWGRELHRRGYGDFTAALFRELCASRNEWSSPQGMYILGFITHAFLDRHTHPYVEAWAGWGRDRRYAHPFLERLIDAELFSVREGRRISDISCFQWVNLGKHAPDPLVKLLSEAAQSHFSRRLADDAEVKVIHAYLDTMGFLEMTDSWDPVRIRSLIAHRDPEGAKRLISLYHPPHLPVHMDVLNLSRSPWGPKPGVAKSFLDLLGEAKDLCTEVIRQVMETECQDAPDIAPIVGNEGLNAAGDRASSAGIQDPLPLPEALEALYRSILAYSPP